MTNTETFYIIESSDRNARREGRFIKVSSLTVAKRKATAGQVFHGTCLTICETHGGEVLAPIARKEDGAKWSTAEGY